MYSIFSDDGSWITVFREDSEYDEPEEMTLQEFIARYGEENLPEHPSLEGFIIAPNAEKVFNNDELPHYYTALRRFVHACGNATVRMQRVEAENYRTWCKWVGVHPIPRNEENAVIKRLYDKGFRRRMYYRIDKYNKAGVLKSFGELVYEIDLSYIKQGQLPW